VLEEICAGLVRARFSSEGTSDVSRPEAVRVVLQAAAQRLQTMSGRTFSGRIEVADFVAEDPLTQSVLSNLRDFAALDGVKRPLKHICLVGERGVGKEKFAQLIHKWSSRAEEPYVAIHFGAVPNELAASELFGAKRGAYSGSVSDRDGIIQRAGAGTLFLDELDEASESLQALIKRVVQLGVFNVVGEASESKTNARFIAATNVVDVDSLKIKKDLKDRFLLLRVPPLRERRADIRPLAERFAAAYELVLPEPAVALLERLDWPGNVRQLQTVIDRSCAIAGKGVALTLELVQRSAIEDGLIGKKSESNEGFRGLGVGETLEGRLDLVAEQLVAHALATCNGNRTHAAAMLGVTRQTLLKRMKSYGLG
jgi:DNA-binding NtrC family response regulator